MEQKEDIAKLQFGEDFSDESGVEALLNAEVKVREASVDAGLSGF